VGGSKPLNFEISLSFRLVHMESELSSYILKTVMEFYWNWKKHDIISSVSFLPCAMLQIIVYLHLSWAAVMDYVVIAYPRSDVQMWECFIMQKKDEHNTLQHKQYISAINLATSLCAGIYSVDWNEKYRGQTLITPFSNKLPCHGIGLWEWPPR